MDKTQEKYKIFERIHKELKQDNKEQGTCNGTSQSPSSLNQNYWNHDNFGKSLRDFNMKPLSF